jgi:hypothetical protein
LNDLLLWDLAVGTVFRIAEKDGKHTHATVFDKNYQKMGEKPWQVFERVEL